MIPNKNDSLIFDESLPFFAYGIFKPGNLAFLSIEEYAIKVVTKVNIKGNMHLRDGLLLLDNESQNEISNGTLIYFTEGKSEMAYKQILKIEPEYIYETKIYNHEIYGKFNYLTAKETKYGEIPGAVKYDYESHGEFKDPYFDDIFKVITKIVNNEYGLEKLFYLQMAYYLLWLSIERYLSFRYTLSPEKRMYEKLYYLSKDESFINFLKNFDEKKIKHKTVFSSSKKNWDRFDKNNPLATLNYFNMIRNNITHRGKFTPPKDIKILTDAINFLLVAFKNIIDSAFAYSTKRMEELIKK